MGKHPGPLAWIGRVVLLYVLVNLFLQIYSKRSIGADHFVGAHACVRWDVSSGIANTHVRRIVADGMVGALDCRVCELLQKLLMGSGFDGTGLLERR